MWSLRAAWKRKEERKQPSSGAALMRSQEISHVVATQVDDGVIQPTMSSGSQVELYGAGSTNKVYVLLRNGFCTGCKGSKACISIYIHIVPLRQSIHFQPNVLFVHQMTKSCKENQFLLVFLNTGSRSVCWQTGVVNWYVVSSPV